MTDRPYWSTRQIRVHDLRQGDVFRDIDGDWSDNHHLLGQHGPFDLIEIQVPESEPSSGVGVAAALAQQAARDAVARQR